MLSAFNFAPTQEDTEVQTEKKKFFARKSSKVSSSENMESKADSRDAADVNAESKEKRSGLFKASKTQKKALYSQFSDDPKVVLEVVSEDGIPEPTTGDDVVVKVQVRCIRLRTLCKEANCRSSHFSISGVHCHVQ
jgi:hypothetical protein